MSVSPNNTIIAIGVSCWWCNASVYHTGRVVRREHRGRLYTWIEIKTDDGWKPSEGATCICKKCEGRIKDTPAKESESNTERISRTFVESESDERLLELHADAKRLEREGKPVPILANYILTEMARRGIK